MNSTRDPLCSPLKAQASSYLGLKTRVTNIENFIAEFMNFCLELTHVEDTSFKSSSTMS